MNEESDKGARPPHASGYTEQPGRSASIASLATALAKAQGQMAAAAKDVKNEFYAKKYADLASVWEACRGALSANGLSVIQLPRKVSAGVEVETILAHASGEWISNLLCMPVSKPDAQGVGSAITYARRYALAAIVGVAPDDDDDGNAASNKPSPASQYKRPAAKPQAPVEKPDQNTPQQTKPAPEAPPAPAKQQEQPVSEKSAEAGASDAQEFDDLGEESQAQGLTITNATYKDGKSQGKDVRVYLITCSDGKLYSTLDEAIFKDAEIAIAEKLEVIIKADAMKKSGTMERYPIVEFQVIQ